MGSRFAEAERLGRIQAAESARSSSQTETSSYKAKAKRALLQDVEDEANVEADKADLDWATVLKRSFDSYIRGERPNMYGEWIHW